MNGNETVKTSYTGVDDFLSSGLAVVWRGENTYGMIDKQDNIVVPMQFTYIDTFHDGIARMNFGGKKESRSTMVHWGKWGVLNDKGEEIIPATRGYVGQFSEGLIDVSLDGGRGYIDRNGEVIISGKYYKTTPFINGIAKVGEGTKYGLINKEGEVILPIKYEKIGEHDRNLIRVTTRGYTTLHKKPTTGFVNRQGEFIIPLSFYDAKDFSEGYVAVMTHYDETVNDMTLKVRKWKYIDEAGNSITEYEYDEAEPFSDGMAKVYKNHEGYGFINTQGQLVVPCQYTEAQDFHNGKAKVKKYKETFVIDKSGNVIN